MANAGQYLADLQRETADYKPDPQLAMLWLQHRYNSVCERVPWNFLHKEATFLTMAEITAGTVTVTLGSATVTETTSNANGWSSAVEGRYFRRDGDSEFYPIDTFGDANPDTLTLNRVYEGDSGTVVGYTIFQRFYSLASDCREVLSMCVIDAPTPMREVSQKEMDDMLCNRPSHGNPPRFWAMAGRDSSDLLRVEIYPTPDEAHGILYRYLQKTPTLSDADTSVIAQVPFALLRSGWLSDYWSWRAARQDAPPQAIAMSQKMEAEFEKRFTELIVRECGNMEPKRLRIASRFTGHRQRGKFSTDTANIILP